MARKKMDRSFLVPAPAVRTVPPANVLPFRQPGVEVRRDGTNKILSIHVRLPKAEKPVSTLASDLELGADWLACEHLAIPFAEAAYSSLNSQATISGRQALKALHFFFRFLVERDAVGLRLSDLDRTLFNGYIAFLNSKNIADLTKAQRLQPLRKIVTFFQLNEGYRSQIPVDCVIARNPWPGRAKRINPRQGLPISQLVGIERACLREMAVTMDCYDRGEEFEISARVLMPFVVMLAIRTAFNPETVLHLERTAFKPSTLLSGSMDVDGSSARHRIVGQKKRAKADQIRTYPTDVSERDNPVRIMADVEKLTEKIRGNAMRGHEDRIFLFKISERGARGARAGKIRAWVRGFMGSSDLSFADNLRKFYSENSLGKFTLASIRPAVSEIVDILTGGDLKAQQVVLNHFSVETTDEHYVSTESKVRRQERLSALQNGRERFIRTSGKSDPRRKSPEDTARAATTGFECADPYDSPIKGQEKGRLCTAWGACASCPMAMVNPRDPRALANLVRMNMAIETARSTLHPARWLQHWGPIQADIKKWIEKFTDQRIWKTAESVLLPPLGTIE